MPDDGVSTNPSVDVAFRFSSRFDESAAGTVEFRGPPHTPSTTKTAAMTPSGPGRLANRPVARKFGSFIVVSSKDENRSPSAKHQRSTSCHQDLKSPPARRFEFLTLCGILRRLAARNGDDVVVQVEGVERTTRHPHAISSTVRHRKKTARALSLVAKGAAFRRPIFLGGCERWQNSIQFWWV